MTKTLTEQWRDGTLEEGLYYIEGNGNHDIALIRNRYCPVLTSPYCEDDVFEPEFVPVEPVPSYGEWKKLDDELKELATMNDTLAMENGRLKERIAIATKALSDIEDGYSEATGAGQTVRQALKEMEGVK